jgi:D-alanine-D-alanine ligase
MVKPRMGGSSVGMSLVRREEDLGDAITAAESSDPLGVLIEDHLPGLPVTIGVLELPGGVVIFPPLATEVHGGDFYDADAKLDAAGEGTVTCTQAALAASVTAALSSYVTRLWDGLGCHGMARADFIVAADGTLAALEVNTTPGISYESNFITAAGLLGLGHADVVIAMLREALTRPRYDAPLPVPDFTDRAVQAQLPLTPRPGRLPPVVPGARGTYVPSADRPGRVGHARRRRARRPRRMV